MPDMWSECHNLSVYTVLDPMAWNKMLFSASGIIFVLMHVLFFAVLSQVLSRVICSDRILTCRIKSIRSPAKVGLVVTDLITSPVVSWEGWETPPPSTAALLSFFAQPPAW